MTWMDIVPKVVDYLSKQQFQNVMMACLVGVIVYFNIQRERADDARSQQAREADAVRAKQTKESHDMVHSVFQEQRAESQQNQDRLVNAVLGVRRDIKANTEATKEIPEAAAVAADKIVKKAAEDKDQ